MNILEKGMYQNVKMFRFVLYFGIRELNQYLLNEQSNQSLLFQLLLSSESIYII